MHLSRIVGNSSPWVENFISLITTFIKNRMRYLIRLLSERYIASKSLHLTEKFYFPSLNLISFALCNTIISQYKKLWWNYITFIIAIFKFYASVEYSASGKRIYVHLKYIYIRFLIFFWIRENFIDILISVFFTDS